MRDLCVVKPPEGGTIPVLMYGEAFEGSVAAYIRKTGTSTGPAPLLPHSQMVPLRLARFAEQRASAAASGVVSAVDLDKVDNDLDCCLDLCFWYVRVWVGGRVWSLGG